MNEKSQTSTKENLTTKSDGSDIGAGRKTGLYGCAFLLLATIVIIAVVILTGVYVPFKGTEGVGP